jgi:Ca-activated chloride channel family protein
VLEKPKAADPKTRVVLRRWLTTLEANLGGTELESALVGVFKSTGDQEPFDVLLITDGEVWDISATVESAKSSGHRIFAIGVGSSPGESLLRLLAEQTGGAALFVNPNEDMTEAMHRLASMMSGPRVSNVKVTWNSDATLEALVSEHLYVGVPFRAMAMFKGPMDTEKQPSATLHFRIGEDSYVLSSSSAASVRNDLAVRYVVAEACLQCKDDEARAAFAEAHQLLSKETAWILVHVRDDEDKADPLPVLSQVPSMHAAGSHGFGKMQILKQVADVNPSGRYKRSQSASFHAAMSTNKVTRFDSPTVWRDPQLATRYNIEALEDSGVEQLPIPSFLRRTDTFQKIEANAVSEGNDEESTMRAILVELLGRIHTEEDLGSLWNWVDRLTLPGLLSEQLRSLMSDEGLSRAQVVALFTVMLMDDLVEPQATRQQRRVLNFVLNEFSDERIEALKQLMWDATEMARATASK